jgi:deoxyadenosine/deoxycytidine kinase
MVKHNIQHRYIAVEGCIGSGKTTLVNLLAAELDARVVLDESDNPFLRDYYEDKRGAAFQAQLFFLLSRHRQQTELNQADLFQQLLVCDYLFEKDKIFAYLSLEDSELALYEKLYNMLAQSVPVPELVVYLQASDETLRRRIEKRNRIYESDISDEYILELNRAYNYFFSHYGEAPLLTVQTDGVNFMEDRSKLLDLIVQMETMTEGTRLFLPLGSDS